MEKIKINNSHLDQLELLLNKVNYNRSKTVPLLDWLRSLQIDEIQDQLIDLDFQAKIFNNQDSDIQVIFYNEDNKGLQVIYTDEPDSILFMIRFKTKHWRGLNPKKHLKLKKLFLLLLVIMLSDCTGCCNALDYINLTHDGVLAFGNISKIYHS